MLAIVGKTKKITQFFQVGLFLDADIVKSLSENRQTHEAIYKGNFENGFFVAVSDGMGGYATDKHIAEKNIFRKNQPMRY